MIVYSIWVDGHRIKSFNEKRILFGREIEDRINDFCKENRISPRGVKLTYFDKRVKNG